MYFCPHCGNALLLTYVDKAGGSLGTGRLRCQTCPYIHEVREKITDDMLLVAKKVDDVLGGEEAWKNVSKTEAVKCLKCHKRGAYFRQLQIRSADEPMTTFYKCANPECGNHWREG